MAKKTNKEIKEYNEDEIKRAEALKDLKTVLLGVHFKKMLKVMAAYYDIKYISTFKLDMQLYNTNEHKKEFEARIWLSSDSFDGIKLMLYSVNLNETVTDITKTEALEVFSAYMSYYAINEDKFKTTDDFKFDITFEVSNR